VSPLQILYKRYRVFFEYGDSMHGDFQCDVYLLKCELSFIDQSYYCVMIDQLGHSGWLHN